MFVMLHKLTISYQIPVMFDLIALKIFAVNLFCSALHPL